MGRRCGDPAGRAENADPLAPLARLKVGATFPRMAQRKTGFRRDDAPQLYPGVRTSKKFHPFLRRSFRARDGSLRRRGLPAQAGVDQDSPRPHGERQQQHRSRCCPSGSPGTLRTSLPPGGLSRAGTAGRPGGGGRPFASADAAPCRSIPPVPGALRAATSLSVFRTEDGGNRWARLIGQSQIAALGASGPMAMVTVRGTLYVVSSRRLLASRDNGQSWEILYDLGEAGWIQAFATHPAAPKRLYLVIYGPEHPHLLRSVDSGHAWPPLPQPFPEARIDRLAVTATAVTSQTAAPRAGSSAARTAAGRGARS